jgi:hypothetical protein
MDWEEFADGCINIGKFIGGIAALAMTSLGGFAYIAVPIALAIWPSLSNIDKDPSWLVPWLGIFLTYVGIYCLMLGLAIRHGPGYVKNLTERIANASNRTN